MTEIWASIGFGFACMMVGIFFKYKSRKYQYKDYESWSKIYDPFKIKGRVLTPDEMTRTEARAKAGLNFFILGSTFMFLLGVYRLLKHFGWL